MTVAAYIGSAIGKPLSADALEVYFDLLGDLPADHLRTAARRVLLEHRWNTFPSIAELREAAVETGRGEVKAIGGAEAWGLAWRAVGRMDPEVKGSVDRELESLPPTVAAAMVAFGINDLCYGKEPVAVLRGQFLKTFEQLAARDKRAAILPATVLQAIQGGNGKPAVANDAPGGIVAIGDLLPFKPAQE